MATNKLKNTKVYRSGSTVNHWNFEHKNCKFSVDPHSNNLNLIFTIASKGGGNTDVKVSIGKEDIPHIMNEIFEHVGDDLKPNFTLK